MTRLLVGIVALGLALPAISVYAADWQRQGGDPGMSKYSPHNIPADASWRQLYSKRFYAKPNADSGTYFYGYAVPTHGGLAVVLADDRPGNADPGFIVGTIFDFRTGQAQTHFTNRYYVAHEVLAETDTHHHTNPIIWHSDGRIYSRRGGDNPATTVYDPAKERAFRISNRNAQGIGEAQGVNNVAVLQTYNDVVICRYGDFGGDNEFTAGSIAEVCFVEPNVPVGHPDVLGRRVASLGPSLGDNPDPDGFYRSWGTYGDVPKAVDNVCVVASLALNSLDPESWPYNTYVYLQATDLLANQRLWTRAWPSDAGGIGFAGVKDFWRFVATDTGHYVFFTRGRGQPTTLRAVDLRTGEDRWSREMADPDERPLMAWHGGFLYVIGRGEQFKLALGTGDVVWRTTHSFPGDRGYVVSDPIYRPMVLTDDTLWFVDGDSPLVATLVGMRTSDGQVIRRTDLTTFYANTPGERLAVVNDLVLADGLVGILVGVRGPGSATGGSNLQYQDLFVFQPIPVGDANGDGSVDIQDVILMAGAFGTSLGQPGFDPAADLNQDGEVDVVDLLTLIEHWGQGA